ncbi:phosphatase PAP2 family protein [Actinoplanes subtropicus]|uniref:phosphatase PAP2 family protein n=1 Tax=Actinoplanes subtropicus TaxID=543632 RepID=UPI000692181A|nr:phosphatase PAP2 family protein [Actinoplanes subtropicus]
MAVTVGRRVSRWWLVGAAAAGFVLLAALVLGHVDPLLDFDERVSRTARSAALAHPLLRAAMSAVTFTGSTRVLGPLAALGCVILLAFRRWRQAVFVAVAMITTVAIRLIVVTLIARTRPTEPLVAVASFSFPSGHSTASAAAALVLVVVCRPLLRRGWSRVLLYVVAGSWAVAVGLSRVVLAVHWPTDVLGAWLFVLIIVPATGLLLDRLSPVTPSEPLGDDPD